MHACKPTEATTLLCDAEVDVVVLLDGSGSLGQKGWDATVEMGKKLTGAFNNAKITNKRAQVAVQLFGGPKTWGQFYRCAHNQWVNNQVQVNMETDCGITWVTPQSSTNGGRFTEDTAGAATAIASLTWPKSSTFTSMALMQAYAQLPLGRRGVQKVVVVVTDGIPISTWLTERAASMVKGHARLIWVPVTPWAPQKDLERWATAPSSQNVIRVEDFNALKKDELVDEIIRDVCSDGVV
jgi:hypothetical protein